MKDDEDGATLLEYTVLLGIMLVAGIATIIILGDWINAEWTTINNALPRSQPPASFFKQNPMET